jgi:hypothetical protein
MPAPPWHKAAAETSIDDSVRRGSEARRMLLEAAWSYRYISPRSSSTGYHPDRSVHDVALSNICLSSDLRPNELRCPIGGKPSDCHVFVIGDGLCVPPKTRSGKPCMSPAVSGKRRCRMHGGAPGSGAPRGNQNALKHGLYTREAIDERRQLRALVRQSRMLIQKIE